MATLDVQTKSGEKIKVQLDPSLRVNRQVVKIQPQDQIDIQSEQDELLKKLRGKRVGKDLVIQLEHEGAQADLVLENYFQFCGVEAGASACSPIMVNSVPYVAADLAGGIAAAVPDVSFALGTAPANIENATLLGASMDMGPVLSAVAAAVVLVGASGGGGKSADAKPVQPPGVVPDPPPVDNTPPATLTVSLAVDTGSFSTDGLTNNSTLVLAGTEAGATVQ